MGRDGGKAVVVDGRTLTREDVVRVARGRVRVELAPAARRRIEASRAHVERILEENGAVHVGVTHREVGGHRHADGVYGVTTGFGDLARVRIPGDKLEELQDNLLLSHAAGVGEPLPEDVVRAMLLLRANALAVGLSGVRPVVVERLLDLLNHRITPVVPSRGSLGASGDLVPLAHAALVLTGRGQAYAGDEPNRGPVPAENALGRDGLRPIRLSAKEGLALINGTQLMQALLALALHDGWGAIRAAEVAGAMSVEALLGSEKPFDPRVHAARPHPGQQATAANLKRLLSGSAIVASHADCDRVQDAYSLRCIPQVLGAARDALTEADRVLSIEMNSATDNPLVLEDGEVVSAGNFHGEPLALVGLYAAAALAEVGSMSERRTARLVDPHLSGLPAFLTTDPGLQSGLMIPQYVAAGLVMENRVLAAPAATDSIPTSANQEDHVSNGAVQALHLARLVRNVETVVGIELLTAAQALDLRAPLAPAPATGAAHAAVRAAIPHHGRDRLLAPDLAEAARLVHDGVVVAAAARIAGDLG